MEPLSPSKMYPQIPFWLRTPHPHPFAESGTHYKTNNFFSSRILGASRHGLSLIISVKNPTWENSTGKSLGSQQWHLEQLQDWAPSFHGRLPLCEVFSTPLGLIKLKPAENLYGELIIGRFIYCSEISSEDPLSRLEIFWDDHV